MATETDGRGWTYLGVGCLTGVSGLASGGMIAVLVAKIVGWARGCPANLETGAPCNWLVFAGVGAIVGLLSFPTVAILRIKQGRTESRNSERG